MSNPSQTKYVTALDFVVPAGTSVFPPPTSSTRWRNNHEALVAIDRDHTAYLSFDLVDGLETGLIVEAASVEAPKVVPIGVAGPREVGEGFRIEPDQVLTAALGLNDEVVVIGIGKDGALTVASSCGAAETMTLMDLAKRWMLAQAAAARGLE